jgi:hypothetical protein
VADDCSKSFVLSSSSGIDGKVVAIHSHDCLLDSCSDTSVGCSLPKTHRRRHWMFSPTVPRLSRLHRQSLFLKTSRHEPHLHFDETLFSLL